MMSCMKIRHLTNTKSPIVKNVSPLRPASNLLIKVKPYTFRCYSGLSMSVSTGRYIVKRKSTMGVRAGRDQG